MTYAMRQLMHDVAAFHRATGQPVLTEPQIPPGRLELRIDLLKEEFDETIEAMRSADLVETADGLADLIYVAIGAALEFGIPLDLVWAEVQRSNMAKIDKETGKVLYHMSGKVAKPEGWAPPDIAGVLYDGQHRGEVSQEEFR